MPWGRVPWMRRTHTYISTYLTTHIPRCCIFVCRNHHPSAFSSLQIYCTFDFVRFRSSPSCCIPYARSHVPRHPPPSPEPPWSDSGVFADHVRINSRSRDSLGQGLNANHWFESMSCSIASACPDDTRLAYLCVPIPNQDPIEVGGRTGGVEETDNGTVALTLTGCGFDALQATLGQCRKLAVTVRVIAGCQDNISTVRLSHLTRSWHCCGLTKEPR